MNELIKLEEALKVAREKGDKDKEVEALYYLGQFFKEKGDNANSLRDLGKALRWFKKALTLSESMGYRLWRIIVLDRIGRIYWKVGMIYKNTGKKDKGKRYFEKALPIIRETGSGREVVLIRLDMGDVLLVKDVVGVDW